MHWHRDRAGLHGSAGRGAHWPRPKPRHSGPGQLGGCVLEIADYNTFHDHAGMALQRADHAIALNHLDASGPSTASAQGGAKRACAASRWAHICATVPGLRSWCCQILAHWYG